tara:strand:- start:140 stop:628 length:489 start_codon:yes stop_codon:yes gene_type:complete
MNNIQHYKTLGLNPNASENDIKKKYKQLALKYHPDRNKDVNAEEKFKKISEAYTSLVKKNTQSNNFSYMNDMNDIIQQLFRENKQSQQSYQHHPFFSTNINFHTMSNNANNGYSIPRITRSIIFENGVKKEKIVKIENNKEITTIITDNNGKITKEVKIKNL